MAIGSYVSGAELDDIGLSKSTPAIRSMTATGGP